MVPAPDFPQSQSTLRGSVSVRTPLTGSTPWDTWLLPAAFTPPHPADAPGVFPAAAPELHASWSLCLEFFFSLLMPGSFSPLLKPCDFVRDASKATHVDPFEMALYPIH